MRKELYLRLCNLLTGIYRLDDGSLAYSENGAFKFLVAPDGFITVLDNTFELPATAEQLIKHVDLWNQNVDFLDQEDAWPRPAVFVEFGTITYSAIKGTMAATGSGTVKLHIVTDWQGSASEGSSLQVEALEVFDLSEVIRRAIYDIKGEWFHGFLHVETATNSNHEEILENIETYNVRCTRPEGPILNN